MFIRTWKYWVPALVFLLLAQGCSGVEIVVTPAPTPIGVKFTPIPTLTTQPPLPTKAIVQLATSTLDQRPFTSFYVTTSADNVNLRTEPGTLFPVSRLLANGTRLQVWGHSPGGQWLYVKTDSNIYGWVLAALVNGGHDGGPSPVIEPQNVQVVKGRVIDLSGVPVSGIGFAVTQGSGPAVPRTDGVTDVTGQFYAFLPLTAGGQWIVSYVSVSCTSNTMDANCNCVGGLCGKADPDSQVITLPFGGILQFTWN